MHQEIIARFNSLKEKQLSIDITRGKPDKNQLDLSDGLFDISISKSSEDGLDLRNYGEPFGIKEARRLGSELLNTPIENVIAESSLAYYLRIKQFYLIIFLQNRCHGKI